MTIRFGPRDIVYPSTELGELRDSSPLLDDPAALRARMEEDGYLLLRGLLDRDAVLNARQAILEHMDEQAALTPGRPVLEGAMPQGGRTVPMMGRRGVTHAPAVRAVLEAEALFDFYRAYFDRPALTFDYKWLRGVGNEEYTGAHYDVVYMGRGSDHLHTCWVPLGDISVEQGTLAICVGSHNAPGFARLRETYGRVDVDRDRIEGWFSQDPMELSERYGGQWKTAEFRAGDVITFGMYAMHASTTNLTDRFRLSCDIRFQPADEPVDERWVGENPIGHYTLHEDPGTIVRMADARAAWGV